MKINWGLMLAAAGVVALGAVWMTRNGGEAGARVLKPDDAAVVARGETVYRANCAACHGERLQGQPGWRTTAGKAPPHDATGHTWHHPEQLLVRITKLGTAKLYGARGGAMPGFGGQLSDADIIAALSYIKSRWPGEIRAANDRMSAKMQGMPGMRGGG